MRHLWGLLAALSTAACTGLNPALDTAWAVWGPTAPRNYAKGFEYLEVSVGRHQTVMALGSRQVREGAVIEQWFSAQGEMLELRDGRVHRVLGMPFEVRQTQASPPPWAGLVPGLSAQEWTRQRQVMPGYRLEQAQVRSQATESLTDGRVRVNERVQAELPDGQTWRYTDRFVLQAGQVVASEQCISVRLCVALKPLGVVNP